MLLRFLHRAERAQIFALARLGIFLARIESVFARFEFADHGNGIVQRADLGGAASRLLCHPERRHPEERSDEGSEILRCAQNDAMENEKLKS